MSREQSLREMQLLLSRDRLTASLMRNPTPSGTEASRDWTESLHRQQLRLQEQQQLLECQRRELQQQISFRTAQGPNHPNTDTRLPGLFQTMIYPGSAIPQLLASYGTPHAPNFASMRSELSPSLFSIVSSAQYIQNSNAAQGGLPLNANVRSGLITSGNVTAMRNNMSASFVSPPTPDKQNACLSFVLASPSDATVLSEHQSFLRLQIEAFSATADDVFTHTRGRNKRVNLGQAGIRCRHCAHVPVRDRLKGSTYYPSSTLGFYQAAQNMLTTHIQCGFCPEMPVTVKTAFSILLATKDKTSGAGRAYWSKQARGKGLVDTDHGAYFCSSIPPGVNVIAHEHTIHQVTKKARRYG